MKLKHLIRAGAVLLGILVLAFVLPRLLPREVTSELEPYGFYSGRDNTAEWATWPLQYADPIRCNSCHQDKLSVWVKSEHKTVNCENCHGPGETHVEKGTPLVVDSSRELCSLCHAKVLGRPADFPQVDINEHSGKSECVTCHNPHNPTGSSVGQTNTLQKPVNLPRIPHTLEGRSDCLLCHKAGGIKPFPQNHEGRSQSSCTSCHSAGEK